MKIDPIAAIMVSLALAILFISMLFTPVTDTSHSPEWSCPIGETMTETDECVPLSFYE